MENIQLRIENWEAREVEEICYSASLNVPQRQDLLRILPTHLNCLQYSWQCKTGILSKTKHLIIFCIYREYHEPKVGVFISITNSKQTTSTHTPVVETQDCPASKDKKRKPNDDAYHRIVEVKGVDLTFTSGDGRSMVEDNLTILQCPKQLLDEIKEGFDGENMQFWQCTCGWPDSISKILFVFHVVQRKPPRIVVDNTSKELESTVLMERRKVSNYLGLIDVKDLFLSPDWSDVTIICDEGNVKFCAHLLILCSRSKYFAAMFSSSMKESKEKIIEIKDLSGPCVKELLRFIYRGEILVGQNNKSSLLDSKDQDLVKQLFVAADKYGMEDLKLLTERSLIEMVSVENVIEVYELCVLMHVETVLLDKCKEILLWNKDKFASDPVTLKEFTCKYPELMWELLRFEN